ncbi:MAG: carboxypeptidase-like regulatory domain-containing protein [Planctomycetes bacterium]|jgi:hypothetical protein|nr:carboxypeptidase-like regulatory domain-containing protein [Planctomycetota bacterium]
MKWLLPLLGAIGMAALLLSGGSPPPADPPPRSPDQTAITGDAAAALAAPKPLGPAPDEPDLAGEVIDGEGRLVARAEIVVTGPGGEVVARAMGNPDGAFALRVKADPPLAVRAEPGGEAVTVRRLPRVDLELLLPRPPGGEDEVIVRPCGGDPPEDAVAEILIRDTLGQTALRVRSGLSHAPWVLGPLPHGDYGLVVRIGELAGTVPVFSLGPHAREVVVELAAAGGLRATFSRRARAILLARDAVLAPLSRAQREADGLDAVVRGAVARVESVEALVFTGIPAGSYSLRILGEGIETIEIPLALAPGERRDLGRIELEPAGASLAIDLDEGGARRDGYVVHLYSPAGLCLRRETIPGNPQPVRFGGLSSGEWFYRVGRTVGGPRHTQSVGWHRRVVLARGETREVREDCSWRFD